MATLSSRPAAFRSNKACLIVRSGTAPYIEYSVIGKASTYSGCAPDSTMP